MYSTSDFGDMWDLSRMHPRQWKDAEKHNENVANGMELCRRCNGTGNEFYEMFRTCTDCNGTGNTGRKNADN